MKTSRPLALGTIATAMAASMLVPTSTASSAAGGSASAVDARRITTDESTARGYGGAVTSVDSHATEIGLEVLRSGGNAADAAIATAAALGVTEPYSAGVGGGGYFVYYDAESGKVQTIDGRETSPASMPDDAFVDPDTGKPYTFTPDLVTSGVSVGAPGTPATWDRVVSRWGTKSLRQLLKPSIKLADKGFVVDKTFRQQTLDNLERFSAFPATKRIFLPRGDAPRVGSRLRNKDLAATYRLLARKGTKAFYTGKVARDIVDIVRKPEVSRDSDLPVPPGYLTMRDLARYEALDQKPTKVAYRGYDVYGMAPSSSGGSTVGEALQILEQYDVAGMSDAEALHYYLEASALAFADRGAYVGDPAKVDVPLDTLLSDPFAASRACSIDPDKALTKPLAAGDLEADARDCTAEQGSETPDTENVETTNLTVTDRWGNVAEYTLTIEQTGGSGMVVPGRGFLLNNELTDFSTVYDAKDPNRIEGGKRPRSSMSPTLVLRDGEPFLALGSPGGSTIITTVLQMMFNRLERGMTIAESIAAPRASQRNTANVTAEQAFIDEYDDVLKPLGHNLVVSGDSFTSAAEIGAATAIEFHRNGSVTAVAEPTRRGGGTAGVVRPGR